MKFVVNTDGASRGNPGQASYGYIIKTEEGVIMHQEGKAIGIATNNVAEYSAVLAALNYIQKRWGKRSPLKIEIVTDSQLIAMQLSGKYKIKNLGLKTLFDAIKLLEMELGEILYKNVPRAQNFIADRLANQALDNLKKATF